MTRFARSFRSFKDKVRDSKRANDLMADLAGKPRLDYSGYELERKRAAPVRDENVPSEHQSQAVVISWWRLNCAHYELPHFSLLAIPNGGARDPITGARLKAEGVRPGVPDLLLAVRRQEFGGLFIEMKRAGGSTSPTQKEVIAYLQAAGYCCRVAFNADAAIESLRVYLRKDAI